MKSLAIACCAIFAGLSAATAHTSTCSYTETREINLPSSGSLDVETNGVGAITASAWENDYVLLRARVSTSAHYEYQARAIAARVEVETTATRVRVSGPSGESWAVAYEILVPRATELRLRTRVGAISVTGVSGAVTVETSVGALELTSLSGPVDARTEVGAIRIQAPPEAASFDLRTAMGAIHTDLPGAHVESTSFFGRKLVLETGNGGPRVRAETSMGQIDLMRAAR